MKRASEFCSVITAAVLLLGHSVQQVASAEPMHTWRMATSWGGGPLMDVGSRAFADRVRLLTEGRIAVEVFPAGKLGHPLKVTETVVNGDAEIGHTWMGLDWGKDRTAVLFGGFAGSMDSERTIHWIYEAGGLELWRRFRDEKFGVVSMPCFIRTPEVFLHSRKPVRSLDDFRNLKIRTAGAWLEIAKELGADTVTMPGKEVFAAIESGAIDASEWGTLWENTFLNLDKITKYVIVPGVHQPVAPFELVVNKDAWSALSERDKNLVEIAAKLVTLESWTRIGHEDAKAIQHFRNAGNEIIELDPSFQIEARRQARAWAEAQARDNLWFAEVWKSQQEFEELWKDAPSYRTVKDTL